MPPPRTGSVEPFMVDAKKRELRTRKDNPCTGVTPVNSDGFPRESDGVVDRRRRWVSAEL
jgi:hypothetical protein